MAQFPGALPAAGAANPSDTLANAGHTSLHNTAADEARAIGTKVGTGASTPTNHTALKGNGTGTSTWGQIDLTNDVSGALPIASGGTAATTAASARTSLGVNTQSETLQAVYPVGAIYIETTGTNPASTFGFGTWSAFGAGRTLVGVGTSDQAYAAGATGGESNHTLSVAEMPSHTHGTSGIFNNSDVPATGANNGLRLNATANQNTVLDNTGGGGSHNNLQPYIVVYFWKRTA